MLHNILSKMYFTFRYNLYTYPLVILPIPVISG